jgi:hypothetical protein
MYGHIFDSLLDYDREGNTSSEGTTNSIRYTLSEIPEEAEHPEKEDCHGHGHNPRGRVSPSPVSKPLSFYL